ncbi:uroporphyrinogen-III synthase [Tessaracoccus sp. OS52]|uniref:uroporphyrinogen-III synthase n=1 Tax=Tessaracoccus sp. OS52 TaxID=2886691 RepID=UPI001D119D0D|nr:uroporphyrinogen-III synthase [Tessaracoccus sp. OS52]
MLSEGLQRAGARVWCEPVQQPVVLPAGDELPAADWVAITSATTVAVLAELGWTIPGTARIAAVGPATAAALEEAGYRVDLQPGPRSSAEDLLAAWPEGSGSVLVPGSARSRPVLVDGLRERGWDARALPIYTTEPVPPSGALADAWSRGAIDAVVVTSGSVAESIAASLGWPEAVRVVALGRPSAAVLDRLGVSAAVADTQDAEGVVAALRRLLPEQKSSQEESR